MDPKTLIACVLLLFAAEITSAEVVRVEVEKRDDGRYERLIGRIFFTIDPESPANQAIADIRLAPRNAAGLVEFVSDVLVIRAKDPARRRGPVLLEVVNRGVEQSLSLMSGAAQFNRPPTSWDLGDRFALEQGFTLAFLGWQFDVLPAEGLSLQAPVAPIEGVVRGTIIEAGTSRVDTGFRLKYCAADPAQPDATLTVRSRFDEPGRVVARGAWRFDDGGCTVRVDAGLEFGLYEAVYRAKGSPVAGVGFAAVRDFVSYLKYGPPGGTLREATPEPQQILGFGYSQSGRFLREFVRDGFNRDEAGRPLFDGLLIASAGAGIGSFNHRFAMPGEAGNSVLSVLRPVDVPPFADDGLLARAVREGAVPKIVYTFSSSEYWARAGSLTHTSTAGDRDVPLSSSSRLYLLSGTAHAGGPLPATTLPSLAQPLNFAEQRWTLRALLVDLEAWTRTGIEPPASRYPTIAGGELIERGSVSFPKVPNLPFPGDMPKVWRMDFGESYTSSGVITREPPVLGEPYRLLVPQVDVDGNDRGGVNLVEVAVPLGTHTGWNRSRVPLQDFGYLGGLAGSFEPFARTRADREQSGDTRRSIAERYRNRSDYLARVERAARALVAERLVLEGDVKAILQRAEQMWKEIAQ